MKITMLIVFKRLLIKIIPLITIIIIKRELDGHEPQW